MFRILNRCEQRKDGAGISKRLGTASVPYPETCIVLAGQAAMVVDAKEVVGSAGDVIEGLSA